MVIFHSYVKVYQRVLPTDNLQQKLQKLVAKHGSQANFEASKLKF